MNSRSCIKANSYYSGIAGPNKPETTEEVEEDEWKVPDSEEIPLEETTEDNAD